MAFFLEFIGIQVQTQLGNGTKTYQYSVPSPIPNIDYLLGKLGFSCMFDATQRPSYCICLILF